MKKLLLLALISMSFLSANAGNSVLSFKAKWGIPLAEFERDYNLLQKLEEKKESGSFNFEPLSNVKHTRDSKNFLALMNKYR